MRVVFHYMEAVTNSGEPILITGETGVGKELIAKGMHLLGKQKGKLISVNLASLDDVAFSDTLFGHKKGAFTGANQDRKGFINQAGNNQGIAVSLLGISRTALNRRLNRRLKDTVNSKVYHRKVQ